MKTVLIEYTLNDDANVAEVEAEIARFVANIRTLDAGVRYASHKKRGLERSYAHIGQIPSDAALAKLQSAEFFERFAGWLKGQCAKAPAATWLDTIATTE